MARTKKPKGEKCVWTVEHEGDWYTTDCGFTFVLTDGTPSENGVKYCLFCGRHLKENHKERTLDAS